VKPPPLDRASALFLDVDGTLLDIAPRPELVEVPPDLPSLLARLAEQRGGALALISGRSLADLGRLFPAWCGAAAGLHGAERRDATGTVAGSGLDLADHAAAAAIDRLRPRLREYAAAAPGVRLEDKGMALALHYRQAPDRQAEIRALAEALIAEAGGSLALIAGKMVFEFRPAHRTKGHAIAAFLAEPPFRGRSPVFLGDDVTDEDGFAEVNRRGGRSIRIGDPIAATLAAYALPSVAAALTWLAAGLPPTGNRSER
jgi:trehalose 6-phosphate phosphatase